MKKLYRVILLKNQDVELGDCWTATMFFDNGSNKQITCDDVRGLAIEVKAIEDAEANEAKKDRAKVGLRKALSRGSVTLRRGPIVVEGSEYPITTVCDEDGDQNKGGAS